MPLRIKNSSEQRAVKSGGFYELMWVRRITILLSSLLLCWLSYDTGYQTVPRDLDVSPSSQPLYNASDNIPSVSTTTTDGQSSSSSSSSSSLSSSSPVSGSLRPELATKRHASPEWIWTTLLEKGPKTTDWAAIEVGMHRPLQCLQAATAGYSAHCVEPSPRNFQRVEAGVKQAADEVRKRVHLYNVAAGSEDSTVPFVSTGGTGDHVGTVDVWKMQDMKEDGYEGDPNSIIEVPTKRLDDLFREQIPGKIYIAKIDTQGFEPNVFSGIDNLLADHRIDYILTEYWPSGIDATAGQKQKACIGVEQVLGKMIKYGYTLYAMPVVSHPASPLFRDLKHLQQSRPLDDLMKNCQWYYELEEKQPNDEYKMGYWSDILAIAPGVQVPEGIM